MRVSYGISFQQINALMILDGSLRLEKNSSAPMVATDASAMQMEAFTLRRHGVRGKDYASMETKS